MSTPLKTESLNPIKFLVLLLVATVPLRAQSLDSLEAAITTAAGVQRITLELQLAKAYESKDWKKSVAFARRSLSGVTRPGNDSLRFEAFYQLSASYYGLGDYDSALAYAKEALRIVTSPRNKGSLLHKFGQIYESRANYQLALDSYLQAVAIHNSLKNQKGLANTLNSMSFVYKDMGQYEKALGALKEAKAIYETLGHQPRLAGVIFNMGLMMMEMGNYQEAIPYFRKAMAGLTESNEPQKFSSFYNNMASCYGKLVNTNKGYYDSALYFGIKNLALKKRINDYRGIANAENGLASTYELASHYREEFEHASRAFHIADSLKLKSLRKNALSYLITAEIGLKRWYNLNDHFSEYIDISESLSEESNSRTLNEMAVKYETEKKETDNQRLLQANIQQMRLNRILGAGGALLLLLLISLAYFYREKQKANRKLATQKQQIESNLREKESLLREIHHRVKNNLQVISSLLNMQSHYLDDPRMINAIAEGQSRVKAMALIHQKLYQTDQLSEIDFQEYTEQLISHLAAAFGQPGKNINSAVNGSALKLDIDTAIPLGLILNELITNAYKYAFTDVAEGSLRIDLKRDDNHFYHLRISDSGQGFPTDFSEAKLNSLGLRLVRMLIEQLDGSLTISNEPGAHFYIRFKESKLSA